MTNLPPGRPVLTPDQVRAIRFMLVDRSGWGSQTEIAKMYGVSRACVNDIARGKTWRWVRR